MVLTNIKTPKMYESSIEIKEYISPEKQYFDAQKMGFLCQPLEKDGKGTVWKGTFRKHEIKYSLPKQIFPFHLDVTKNASDMIKSQPQIKNYSFFYAEVPFTVSAVDNYNIKNIFYEITLNFDKTNGHAQIISIFPPKDSLKAGTKTTKTMIKGNLAIHVPEITGLPLIGGISFSLPVNGEKEWRNETLTEISYDVLIPQIESGDNSNDNVHWKFLDNPQFHIGGGHKPALIFGIPKPIADSNDFKVDCSLTIEDIKTPSTSVDVIFN